MKSLSDLGAELDPIQAFREIIVSEYEIRLDHPSCHQFQRRDTVNRSYRAIALFVENEFEQFAHTGIVLHHQDRLRAGNWFSDPVTRLRAGNWFSDPVTGALPMGLGRRRLARRERDLDGENRTLTKARANVHSMAQQL